MAEGASAVIATLAAGLRGGTHQVHMGWLVAPLGGDVTMAIDGNAVETMSDLTVYLEMKTAVGQRVEEGPSCALVSRSSRLPVSPRVRRRRRPGAHKPATPVPERSHVTRAHCIHRSSTEDTMHKQARGVVIFLALAALLACGLPTLAQTGTQNDTQRENPSPRDAMAGLFGGGTFPGGYLKYTYEITRQGSSKTSTTTTEIAPKGDGTYTIASSSTETVPLDMVHIGFFGIPLPRLGIRVSENTSGTIDLSPLSNITSSAIEPGKNYLLPDGGRFQAGEVGTLAGVEVVYGTYTHADYTNVQIQLAFATDLTARSLMPFPAMMEFRYSTAASSSAQPLEMFSLVKLVEFVYRP